LNFYKHHLGDYAKDTGHLSWTEDAAYTRFLRVYYLQEKPLPVEIQACERLIRAVTRREKEAVTRVLNEFFELRVDGWHNKRADEEILKYQAQASTNRRIARERNGNESSHESSTKRIPSQKPVAISHKPDEIKEGSGMDTPLPVALAVALRAAGITGANSVNPQIQQWAAEGVTVEQVTEAARIAIQDRGKDNPGVKYLVGIIADMRAQPVKVNGSGAHQAGHDGKCDEIVNDTRCAEPAVFGNRAGTKWYCRGHNPH
jgi:uncharacterized protein YdaU (DUF1376 family)